MAQVLENKMSWKRFGSREDKVNGQVRTLHNIVTYRVYSGRDEECLVNFGGKTSGRYPLKSRR
jgi:hypothetical protein